MQAYAEGLGEEARKTDLMLVERWGKEHGGSVKEVRAQCPGLSSYKRGYVMSLLEELAKDGRIPVTEVTRQIGQYTQLDKKDSDI